MSLVSFLNKILELFYGMTDSFGLSIILLSFTVTILMLPLFWIAEILQQKERAKKVLMQPSLDEVKNIKNRQEKYYYRLEIYRKNKFSPFHSLIGLLGLLIQVPFFLATYWMLLEYLPLQGESFGPIKDLFQPDRLIPFGGATYNLLPFIMTIINLFAVYLYTKNKDKFENIQLIIIAFVFLILLYNLSSALVLYWTMNNVFAIGTKWMFNTETWIQWLSKFSVKEKIKCLIPNIFKQLNNNNHTNAISLITIINIIILLLLPIQLITFYDNDFALDILSSLKMILIVVIFSILATVLLYFLICYFFNTFLLNKSQIKFQQVAIGILLFVLAWITLSGYTFPLVNSTGGLISGTHDNLSTNWFNLTTVFICCGLITRLFYTYYGNKIILAFFFVFYLSRLPSSITQIQALNERWEIYKLKQKEDEITKFSLNKNLLVVSFDGLQRSVVQDVFDNDKKIQSEFKDFLFFSKVISTAPATIASMANELFGNINYKEIADNETSLLSNLPLNTILLNQKFGEGVTVSSFGPYNQFNLKFQNKYFINYKKIQWSNLGKIYYYEFDRLFSGKFTDKFIRRLRDYVFGPFLDLLYSDDDIKSRHLVDFNHPRHRELQEYNRWIDNMSIVENDTLTIKYLHFTHTHYPITFDLYGKDHSDDPSWMALNQNYIGVYNQTYFALNQFIDLIKKLKELEVYNNTFLILKSDHGKPTIYFDDYPNNLRINNHKIFGLSRYDGPMLMIKDIDRKDTTLIDIKDLVTLGDLAPTIALNFSQNIVNSTIPPGLNLLDKINKIESPYIYLNLVKDSSSSFQYGKTHRTIRLDRVNKYTLIDLLKSECINLSNDSIQF